MGKVCSCNQKELTYEDCRTKDCKINEIIVQIIEKSGQEKSEHFNKWMLDRYKTDSIQLENGKEMYVFSDKSVIYY